MQMKPIIVPNNKFAILSASPSPPFSTPLHPIILRRLGGPLYYVDIHPARRARRQLIPRPGIGDPLRPPHHSRQPSHHCSGLQINYRNTQ